MHVKENQTNNKSSFVEYWLLALYVLEERDVDAWQIYTAYSFHSRKNQDIDRWYTKDEAFHKA